MPFYIRKSIKLGPFRLNFSKSGVGVSTGIKGARIGMNAKGRKYIHLGRGGIYYRQNLPEENQDGVSTPTTEFTWGFVSILIAVLFLLYRFFTA